MRLYIKGDYAKKITFTTRELVWKMWFKERNGKKISYSNVVMMRCCKMIFISEQSCANGLQLTKDGIRLLL